MENQVEENKVKKDPPAAGARRPLNPSPRADRALGMRNLPWGYGRDRVTAMSVDPERLYCYWEVTDDGIAAARKALAEAGERAWLCLRVYDTTGRLFDGTNAHSYFDQGLDRNARQYFFDIGKPTSEAFVEIGMKSEEGYFVRIARSRRVIFPRREPAAWTEPEWLTVHASGHTETFSRHGGGDDHHNGGHAHPQSGGHVAGAGHHGPEGGLFIDGPTHVEHAPVWAMRFSSGDERIRVFDFASGERVEWEQSFSEGLPEEHRFWSWEDPLTVSSWQSGPFSYPVSAPAPMRETWAGKARSYEVGGRTHVVYGPWQVVIRGLSAQQGRRVIARWQVFRSWVTNESREVRGTSETAAGEGYDGELAPGSSGRGRAGSSERVWRGSSELRLGGSSETFFAGASERRFAGASEVFFAGASERTMKGATERLWKGSSEHRFAGASERTFAGSSERLWRGGSEGRLGGSSERLGGSEHRLGSSEHRGRNADPTPSAYPTFPARKDG